MSDMAMVFLILGLTIALFLWGKLPSDLIAILSLLGLFFAGLVSPVEALAGFSNSTVILVGALFVVGDGLTRTGVTAFAGERLIAGAAGVDDECRGQTRKTSSGFNRLVGEFSRSSCVTRFRVRQR